MWRSNPKYVKAAAMIMSFFRRNRMRKLVRTVMD